jgi:molybdopterin molybdotransferase
MRDVRMRGFRRRTAVEDALRVLEERTAALGPEQVGIRDAAGRVAAAEITARVSVPHFDRAAMDGYAVVGESTFGATAYAPVELRIVGESRPGKPHSGAIARGEAVRITTGAPVPAGADAVLMAENASETEDRSVVRVSEAIAPGKHVGRVGEDVPAGSSVLARGRRLRAQDVGLLASVGIAEISAIRRPSVRILITGDELLPPGSTPRGACIVDSNSLVISELARRDGAMPPVVVYVEDRRDAVREAMEAATEDVLLVSGGSSVGPEDHAPLVLAAVGELTVHGVAMRPSSPAGFGFLRPAGQFTIERPVFLLPGNPVSCLCAYEFFAGPTIRALGGRPRAWPHRRIRAAVAAKIVSELGRTDYVRVQMEERAGEPTVRPIMTSGASILSSTTRADGVVLVASEREGYGEGELVDVLLYE